MADPLEIVLGLLGEFVSSHSGASAAGEIARGVHGDLAEAAERRTKMRIKRALAAADLLTLAVLHDRVVTEAERRELACALSRLFARLDEQVDADELLERWESWRTDASERRFEARVCKIARVLDRRSRERLLASLERVLHAAEPTAANGAYRTAPAQDCNATLAVFERALHADAP